MKKLSFVVLLVLIGVGAYYGWKMWKGEGCCGFGGQKEDPWSTYKAPEEEEAPTT